MRLLAAIPSIAVRTIVMLAYAGVVFGGSVYPILPRVRDRAGLRRVVATASAMLTVHGGAFLGMSLLLREPAAYASTVSVIRRCRPSPASGPWP